MTAVTAGTQVQQVTRFCALYVGGRLITREKNLVTTWIGSDQWRYYEQVSIKFGE